DKPNPPRHRSIDMQPSPICGPACIAEIQAARTASCVDQATGKVRRGVARMSCADQPSRVALLWRRRQANCRTATADRSTTIQSIELHREWIWTTAQQRGSELGPWFG